MKWPLFLFHILHLGSVRPVSSFFMIMIIISCIPIACLIKRILICIIFLKGFVVIYMCILF